MDAQGGVKRAREGDSGAGGGEGNKRARAPVDQGPLLQESLDSIASRKEGVEEYLERWANKDTASPGGSVGQWKFEVCAISALSPRRLQHGALRRANRS